MPLAAAPARKIGLARILRCNQSRRSNMSILLFAVFGLVVGLIARLLMPGRQRMGLLATMLLGMLGSFAGGFLTALITNTRVLDFNTAGILGSIVGAVVVLFVAGGMFVRRRAW
jgi:uncharacterized membrane protein YeaQ/YmgE (transglycosylase-associated protein family)